MFIVLKSAWRFLDGKDNKGDTVWVQPGRHEAETIPNPLGYPGNWIVLKGTLIGQSEGAMRECQNQPASYGKPAVDWGELEIKMEE